MAQATILQGARIGKNCVIFPHAIVSAIPQDLKFRGEETTAIIGDNTTIRECATVNRGTASKGFTKVGNDCLIMAYSHVAHDCILKDHVILGNTTQLAGEVEIDDYAILSGGTLVHQFCRIGAHVMIQGGSKIPKDIPPYVMVDGIPSFTWDSISWDCADGASPASGSTPSRRYTATSTCRALTLPKPRSVSRRSCRNRKSATTYWPLFAPPGEASLGGAWMGDRGSGNEP